MFYRTLAMAVKNPRVLFRLLGRQIGHIDSTVGLLFITSRAHVHPHRSSLAVAPVAMRCARVNGICRRLCFIENTLRPSRSHARHVQLLPFPPSSYLPDAQHLRQQNELCFFWRTARAGERVDEARPIKTPPTATQPIRRRVGTRSTRTSRAVAPQEHKPLDWKLEGSGARQKPPKSHSLLRCSSRDI